MKDSIKTFVRNSRVPWWIAILAGIFSGITGITFSTKGTYDVDNRSHSHQDTAELETVN